MCIEINTLQEEKKNLTLNVSHASQVKTVGCLYYIIYVYIKKKNIVNVNENSGKNAKPPQTNQTICM